MARLSDNLYDYNLIKVNDDINKNRNFLKPNEYQLKRCHPIKKHGEFNLSFRFKELRTYFNQTIQRIYYSK